MWTMSEVPLPGSSQSCLLTSKLPGNCRSIACPQPNASNGLKLSLLEDTDFFPDTNPSNAKPGSDSDSDSESDSDSRANTDSGSDSDSDDSSSCDDSDEDEEEGVEIVWAKAARGVWGLGHVFERKLYFAKDIVDDSFVPKGTKLRAVPDPTAKPAPKATPKPAPKGKHVELFKMKRKVGQWFYSMRVNQNESDWVTPELCG